MTMRQPIVLENASGTDRPNAEELRRWIADLFTGGAFASGVMGATHLKVSQRAAGANVSVDVAAGTVWVACTTDVLAGPYWGHNDAVVNVPLAAADPTNPRRDLIYVQFHDNAEDAGGSNTVSLHVLQGTPAGSPADPSTAGLENFHVLARVTVNAADTTIVDADITDKREYATPFRKAREEVTCILRMSTNQTLVNNTTTNLLWDTEVYDPYGLHSVVSNTHLVTPDMGDRLWRAELSIAWAGTAGGVRNIDINASGSDSQTNIAREQSDTIEGGTSIAQCIAGLGPVSLGSSVVATGFQNRGGTLDILGGTAPTRFSVADAGGRTRPVGSIGQ